jgi:basic amino acid/polyamine antiporter, APA family
VETLLVCLKVGVVVLIIVLGVFYVNTDNYTPFLPFGWAGVFAGASVVFFAVFGYDAMSTAAEESTSARKLLPKAIIFSLAISMVLYVLACLVFTGMVKYTEVDPEPAFAQAFESVGLPWIATLISVGAILGIATVIWTFMYAVTRVWFSMSRDGLLPKWFAAVSPKHRGTRARHLDRGRRLGPDRRLPADRRGRRTDQHRDPACLCGRVLRGHRVAVPVA